jgi:hypothetical protein
MPATRTRLRIDRVLATAPADERPELRERFVRLETACGCRLGALCMLVGTAAAVFSVATGSGSGAMPDGVLVVLALFGSAVVGKTIGVSAAQARLRWLLRSAEGRAGLARVANGSRRMRPS